ncbi:MAG: penicillin-binding protein 2 [Candidatus Berkelbacteria bacterium]|nr:penicillin-binding protein 2 [Candidatus Berkelbacteria bacterium]
MDIFGNFSKLKGDKEIRKIERQSEIVFSYSDLMAEPVGKIENKSAFNSIRIFKIAVMLVFCVLASKLFFLQISQGETMNAQAESHHRPRLLTATRGLILDKNGTWLARNDPSFALAVYPSELPKNKIERQKVYAEIATFTGQSLDEIQMAAEKNGLNSLDQAIIKDNIPHDDALLLEEKVYGMSGVFVAKNAMREYLTTPGLSQILGYTGIVSQDDLSKDDSYFPSDRTGKTGLESSYEQYLRGVNGMEQVEVDSRGNVVKVLVDNTNKEPVSGDNLVLNIDAGLEAKTAEALQVGIETGKKITGQDVNGAVAAVMDVKTGGILSMVSLPSYNNNLFATKISTEDYQSLINDPNQPMFNRMTQGTYPPGSVSKIILASAGLAEGEINKNTSFVTPAAIKIGDYTFPDWKDHSYESTNVERALAESNNVFFYSLGGGFDKIPGLGIDKIKKYWQLFGLGEQTGIDLPSEASGLLPDAAWKQKVKAEPWYLGDTYHVSIGQGDMLVTPIQMLRATAAIANGGTLLQPQLVNKIVDQDGKVMKSFDPRVEKTNIVSPDVIKTVQEGMRLAVTDGSARNLGDLPVNVEGKTGTAQFENNQKTHAWFECYAPYENPQIAIIVMVEGGGEGYDVAAPVAKEILSYYFGQK